MGGDGGVIASNRRYMRGAGTADHTGDYNAAGRQKATDDPDIIRHQATRTMQYCALTQKPLFPATTGDNAATTATPHNTIVACPYGRLYLKEAAVEALLKRKHQAAAASGDNDTTNEQDLLGSHIRGLKHLREARFHLSSSTTMTDKQQLVPTCPITGRELNGQVPAYVLHLCEHDNDKEAKKDKSKIACNVVSEYGLQMLQNEQAALEDEYGVQKDKWRLAPPPAVLEEIQAAWLAKLAQEDEKKAKKKRKKRQRDGDDDDKTKQSSKRNFTTNTLNNHQPTSVSEVARTRVSAAVEKNKVLSSLFTTGKQKLSKKEGNDRLFAGS